MLILISLIYHHSPYNVIVEHEKHDLRINNIKKPILWADITDNTIRRYRKHFRKSVVANEIVSYKCCFKSLTYRA